MKSLARRPRKTDINFCDSSFQPYFCDSPGSQQANMTPSRRSSITMRSKSRLASNTLVLHITNASNQAGVVHIDRQKHIWPWTSSSISTPSSSSSSSSSKPLIKTCYSWIWARCCPNKSSVPRKARVSSHLLDLLLVLAFYAVLMLVSKLPLLNPTYHHRLVIST